MPLVETTGAEQLIELLKIMQFISNLTRNAVTPSGRFWPYHVLPSLLSLISGKTQSLEAGVKSEQDLWFSNAS